MKLAELEARVMTLEEIVSQLQSRKTKPAKKSRWWESDAGRFQDDPVFDEIVELGREYRESLKPKTKQRKGSHSGLCSQYGMHSRDLVASSTQYKGTTRQQRMKECPVRR